MASGMAKQNMPFTKSMGPSGDVVYRSEHERDPRRSDELNEQEQREPSEITGDLEKEYEPIRGRSKTGRDSGALHQSRSRPQSVKSGRSMVSGADLYTCLSVDVEQQQRQSPSADESPVDSEKTFEVKWDGDHDPMNPRNMRKRQKWLIVLIVSVSSVCVYVTNGTTHALCTLADQHSTCTSSIYTSTYGQLMEEFHCSQIVATLGLSLFVVGLGLGPMLLGPLSEVRLYIG